MNNIVGILTRRAAQDFELGGTRVLKVGALVVNVHVVQCLEVSLSVSVRACT